MRRIRSSTTPSTVPVRSYAARWRVAPVSPTARCSPPWPARGRRPPPARGGRGRAARRGRRAPAAAPLDRVHQRVGQSVARGPPLRGAQRLGPPAVDRLALRPVLRRGLDERPHQDRDHDRSRGVGADVADADLDRRLAGREPGVEVEHPAVAGRAGLEQEPAGLAVARADPNGSVGPALGHRRPHLGAPRRVAGVAAVGERRVGADRQQHRQPRRDPVDHADALLVGVDLDVDVHAAGAAAARDRAERVDHVPVAVVGASPPALAPERVEPGRDRPPGRPRGPPRRRYGAPSPAAPTASSASRVGSVRVSSWCRNSSWSSASVARSDPGPATAVLAVLLEHPRAPATVTPVSGSTSSSSSSIPSVRTMAGHYPVATRLHPRRLIALAACRPVEVPLPGVRRHRSGQQLGDQPGQRVVRVGLDAPVDGAPGQRALAGLPGREGQQRGRCRRPAGRARAARRRSRTRRAPGPCVAVERRPGGVARPGRRASRAAAGRPRRRPDACPAPTCRTTRSRPSAPRRARRAARR